MNYNNTLIVIAAMKNIVGPTLEDGTHEIDIIFKNYGKYNQYSLITIFTIIIYNIKNYLFIGIHIYYAIDFK